MELALCRVCATPSDDSAMFRLFDDADGSLLALAEIFLLISGIASDSKLPKCCCERCRNRLREVEDLRNLCQESDRKLRKMIGMTEEDRNNADAFEVIPKVEVFELSESYSQLNDAENECSSSESSKDSKREVQVKPRTKCKKDAAEPVKVENVKSKDKVKQSRRAKAPTTEGKPKKKDTRVRSCQCSVCGRIFASRFNLKEHEVVHNPDRIIKCPICPKVFNRRGNFKLHMAVHNELHKCTECDRSFPVPSKLQEHIVSVHRRERRYQCSLCPKTYQTNSALYTHVKTVHEQTTRYNCDICLKSFSTKDIAERHKLKHQGLRFSACAHCGNKYESINYLKQHIAERHPETIENLSRCVYCGMGYATNCHYRKHVAKKHREHLAEFDEWLKATRESQANGQQMNSNVE